MGRHAGGPFGSPELPEIRRPRTNVREREWREHFDPTERARRLHDYLSRKAANGEGDFPLPLELRKVA